MAPARRVPKNTLRVSFLNLLAAEKLYLRMGDVDASAA